jgi:tetratricopeptide (TPR) repeat protein
MLGDRHFAAMVAVWLLLGAAPFSTASAQSGETGSASLGKVNFPTSCAPAAQKTVERGVALLHSFQYQQVEQAFGEAARQDPHCAIAYWGEALGLYHQLWDFPTSTTLRAGLQYVQEGEKIGARTEREQSYIAAAAAFYRDDAKLSHLDRRRAYSQAMARLRQKFSNDDEGAAFYALSLIALAEDGDNEAANRKQAIAILQPLFHKYPDNPGMAHYLIHATDTPQLASQGLDAARAYARIAPASSHALHMPSHIFIRLGLWQDCINSNLAAAAAAAQATRTHQADSGYQFHAMDFLDYAYLQSGQDAKARALVEELKKVPGASDEEIADEQAMFSARNALESHLWKEAAALPIPNIKFRWQDDTYFARAIGAARSGDVAGARQALNKLKEIIAAREAHNKQTGNAGYPGTAIDRLEAEAWLAFAEGNTGTALHGMGDAVKREENEGVTYSRIPAREMQADMLLELKRPADALAAYKAALRDSPRRFNSLYGAARAAELAGNAAEAREYYATLVKSCDPGADRPELKQATTAVRQTAMRQ